MAQEERACDGHGTVYCVTDGYLTRSIRVLRGVQLWVFTLLPNLGWGDRLVDEWTVVWLVSGRDLVNILHRCVGAIILLRLS